MSLRRKQIAGFTVLEIFTVLAVGGILLAAAAPNFIRWQEDQRLKSTGRAVIHAFAFARSEAIRTGNNHIVFIAADTTGGGLQDSGGNPVDLLVVNDQRPGATSQNCLVDTGEIVGVVELERGVTFGVSAATAPPPTDFGGGAIASGTSITKPDNSAATWVLFRSDGTPLSFASGCTPGAIGSGSGAVYFTNQNRDYSAIVAPRNIAGVQ